MILVHVVQEHVPTAVLHAAEDLELARKLSSHLEVSAKTYLERLRTGLVREGAVVRTLVVRQTNPLHGIVEASRYEHADLIVIAAHGASCDAAKSFGTVTEYLLAHSIVPLLVLQDVPAAESRVTDPTVQIAPPLRASYPPEPA